MYRPKFCCECGSEVERARWRVWTSRRFCPDCSARFRKAHFLARASAWAALFFAGLLAGRAGRNAPPPLLIEPGGQYRAAAAATAGATGGDGTKAVPSPTPGPEQVYGPDGTAGERPTDPDEVVSICGARTQKGTPCRRRVRGTGRCWQHKGMPAIIRNTVVN